MKVAVVWSIINLLFLFNRNLDTCPVVCLPGSANRGQDSNHGNGASGAGSRSTTQRPGAGRLPYDVSLTNDSGYTSPPGAQKVERLEKGTIIPSMSVRERFQELRAEGERPRKSTVLERLEQKWKAASVKLEEGRAGNRLGVQEVVVMDTARAEGSEALCDESKGTPRIQGGLIRKMEVKKEFKQQKQKRKAATDVAAPLKAMPSESERSMRTAESRDSASSAQDDPRKHSEHTSRIPVLVMKADSESDEPSHRGRRSSSSDRSTRDGSRPGSRRSSTGDEARSRKASMEDMRSEPRSRHVSSSSATNPEDGSSRNPSRHSSGKHSPTTRKDPSGKFSGSPGREAGSAEAGAITGSVKSNTVGSEGKINPSLVKDVAPQRHTWPGEKTTDTNPDSTELEAAGRKFHSEDTPSSVIPGGFIPKPPDEVTSPRKSPLIRRNSLRSRHRSGSESGREDDKKDEDSPSGSVARDDASSGLGSHSNSNSESNSNEKLHRAGRKESPRPMKATAEAISSMDHDFSGSSPRSASSEIKEQFVRQSRGRSSVREPKRPKEVKAEKRSSSVGGPCSADSVVTDKPPLARPSTGRPAEPSTPGRKSSRMDQNEKRESKSHERERRSSSRERKASGGSPRQHGRKSPNVPKLIIHRR